MLDKLYIALNNTRKSQGLDTCVIFTPLQLAADDHANDMQINNYCSHISLDGSNYIERVKRFGNITPSGEIICKGPGGKNCIENVIKGWLDSPGHRNILLDPKQRFMGGGYRLKSETHMGNYWVVVFAY